MNDTGLELSLEQVSEIEQHKYFLSEKAGYDVGWEFAEQDWRSNSEQAKQVVSSPVRKDPAQETAPKGLGRFLKRLLSRAASV